jgi:hypothetical protein
MVISGGRWSSAAISMLSDVGVPQGDNLRLAALPRSPAEAVNGGGHMGDKNYAFGDDPEAVN